jgi:acylphosphatase
MAALRLVIHGRVQGVGYRWWTVSVATGLGLDGWVRNRRDGTVEILAIGDAAALESLADACRDGPRAALVDRVERQAADPEGSRGFIERETV